MEQISDLLKSFAGSLRFVVKHKLYFYFLPAIILAVLFYLSFMKGQSISNRMEFMEDWFIIGWLIKGMTAGIKLLAFLTFEIVILVFLTPINSYFAEKVKEDMTGIKAEFDFNQFINSIFRSIRLFFIAFLTEMVLLLIIWILSFLLGNWFNTIVAFVVSSFFIGFSFFDFGLDLDGVKTRKSWKFAKQNKLICLVAGLLFSIAIYIPEQTNLLVLFLITISLVPHMLTIAATQVYYKHYSQSGNIQKTELN